MQTAFPKDELRAVREAIATQTEYDRTIHTQDGYERIHVSKWTPSKLSMKSEHSRKEPAMILQYWICHGNIESFRNYTSYEEWRNVLFRN